MSQHNIIGSEAFTKGPFVIIRGVKSSGLRRRRSGSATAYAIVAILALSAGAAVAAFALGPLMVEAAPAGAPSGIVPTTPTSAAPAPALTTPSA